ncbi:uncharacterized protein NMK_1937 [Novimethylophilus kurashikiensis]|uniref:Uncharacterized protein n=1 Tax=Novimethylophilus kurashikiensis TaxID=1825523 RepID=A0A2R5F9W4_9PROT|nr:hypothetical protein [Novimethylophilus kurashikiensis]GBG14338.1 uncharacterized protein NMK_1937 [Novimethylophilus kurashikiensis]
MEISNNYALAISPAYCYFTSTGSPAHITLRLSQGKYLIYPAGMPRQDMATEEEMWRWLSAMTPTALQDLGESNDLFRLGLYKRAQMILDAGSGMAAHQAKFNEYMLRIAHEILTSLGCAVRHKLKPRRVSPTKSESWWEVRARCNRADGPDGYDWVHIRMFPSPFDDAAWQVEVRMAADGLNGYWTNRSRLDAAYKQLESRGIRIENVLSGSTIILG